jgi:hypothetical protein
MSGIRPFWAWTWGGVLPAGVSIFEIISSFCGGVFFDPVATWWHAVLILSVPLVNAWILKGAPRGSERTRGLAAGFVLVIALFYALLFLPLLPASIIAVIFVGMGLLSLTPVFAGWVTWKIGRARRDESSDLPGYRRGWKMGALAALLALAVLEGPAVWTRSNLEAAAGEGEAQRSAITRLRAFHSERTLLRACYEGNRGNVMGTDISGWLWKGWEMSFGSRGGRWAAGSNELEAIRDVFFRVTGKPFNTLKPPRLARSGFFGRGRGDTLREVEFDNHLGGDQVALRLKHLDLAESRFDGHLDARSRLGYGEWTMVFRNRSLNPQEARCQVLLPRGGRVSRLTLWVEGEHDAARLAPRIAASSVLVIPMSASSVLAARRQTSTGDGQVKRVAPQADLRGVRTA